MGDQSVRPEVADEALGHAIEAEEYEHEGQRVKRDPEKLLRVREGLAAEARVARSGNVLERAMVGAARQG
jgi:hypothetical protein